MEDQATGVIDDEQLRREIAGMIEERPVILFMKGTPEQPYCGFSARVVQALEQTGVRYAAVNVLVDPRIRTAVSAHSDWPTIPQLFVKGELVGGCDIVEEMAAEGELEPLLAGAVGSDAQG